MHLRFTFHLHKLAVQLHHTKATRLLAPSVEFDFSVKLHLNLFPSTMQVKRINAITSKLTQHGAFFIIII